MLLAVRLVAGVASKAWMPRFLAMRHFAYLRILVETLPEILRWNGSFADAASHNLKNRSSAIGMPADQAWSAVRATKCRRTVRHVALIETHFCESLLISLDGRVLEMTNRAALQQVGSETVKM